MTVNWTSLLCGQNKTFEDIILGCGFGCDDNQLTNHEPNNQWIYQESRLIVKENNSCSHNIL